MKNDYEQIHRYTNFILELTTLSQKYQIYIKGCGCCGSPWLYDDKEKENIGDNLSYDNDGGVECYTTED